MIVGDTNLLVYLYVESAFTPQARHVHAIDPDWISVLLHILVPLTMTLAVCIATVNINLENLNYEFVLYYLYMAPVPYISSLLGAVFSSCLRQRTRKGGRLSYAIGFAGYMYFILWFATTSLGGLQIKSKYRNALVNDRYSSHYHPIVRFPNCMARS